MRITSATLLVALLLWGTFFIELGAPLALALLVALVVIYLSAARNLPIDIVGVLVLANVLFWVLHGMIVGAIGPGSFVNPKFYGGEGRIFLSLIPLVALCWCKLEAWDFYSTIKTLYIMAIASIAIYLIWMVTHTTLLSGPGHADEFHGFLSSHTGSGTFFGAISVFALIYTYERRKLVHFLVAVMLLGPVLSSGSREALVGVMGAFAWYWGMKRKHPRVMLAVCLGLLLMIPLVGMMSNKTYNRTIGLLSWESVESVIDQAKVGINSDWQVGDWSPEEDVDNLESGDVTTLVRIMLWVYASKRFLDSPLIGMGWGRFNDTQLVIADVPILGAFAAGGEQVFSTANAHNSYFHLLSESGLFGLVLYLSVWALMFFRCQKAELLLSSIQSHRSYYVACQGLVVYILLCALTGHALASPSVMVPVVTILGVGLAYYRTAIKVSCPEQASLPVEENPNG